MNVYQNWFLASRPWSFTMTAISVSVGSAMGAMEGDFSWPLYLITLAGMIILHAATNLINDYYDVSSGIDFQEVSTAQYRPHPLLEGKLRLTQVRIGALLLYGLAAIVGLYLAERRGWALFWIGLVGVAASLSYTAPPFKYKYKALGEFSGLKFLFLQPRWRVYLCGYSQNKRNVSGLMENLWLWVCSQLPPYT